MVDNTNFMTKFVDGIVFAIVFAYLWVNGKLLDFMSIYLN
jgi:hypothetical protein